MKADTPIALASLKEMTVQEREDLLNGIRERRLAPVRAYEELSAMQALARKENREEALSKACEMFLKQLVLTDKAMSRLEQRGVKLRAIELEIESL